MIKTSSSTYDCIFSGWQTTQNVEMNDLRLTDNLIKLEKTAFWMNWSWTMDESVVQWLLLSTRGRSMTINALNTFAMCFLIYFVLSVALWILIWLFTMGNHFSTILLCLWIVYCYQHWFISPEHIRSVWRIGYAKTCCELCSRFAVVIRWRDLMRRVFK